MSEVFNLGRVACLYKASDVSHLMINFTFHETPHSKRLVKPLYIIGNTEYNLVGARFGGKHLPSLHNFQRIIHRLVCRVANRLPTDLCVCFLVNIEGKFAYAYWVERVRSHRAYL